MKIIVAYPSAAKNIKNHSLVQQFSYLEKIVEDKNISEIIFISFNSTDLDLKTILRISQFKYPELINFVEFGSKLKNLFLTEKSYGEIAKKLIDILGNNLSDVETLYLFGNCLFDRKERKINDIITKYYSNLNSFNFLTARNKVLKTIFYNLLIKTNHIVYDPSELDYEGGENYTKYHCYSDPT